MGKDLNKCKCGGNLIPVSEKKEMCMDCCEECDRVIVVDNFKF